MREFSISATRMPLADEQPITKDTVARLSREVFLWQQRYKALQNENYKLVNEIITLQTRLNPTTDGGV